MSNIGLTYWQDLRCSIFARLSISVPIYMVSRVKYIGEILWIIPRCCITNILPTNFKTGKSSFLISPWEFSPLMQILHRQQIFVFQCLMTKKIIHCNV